MFIKEYSSEVKDLLPLALFVFSDQLEVFPSNIAKDPNVEKIYQRIVQDKHITGKTGESSYIYLLDDEFSQLYFIGAGESNETDIENFRIAGASLCQKLRKFKVSKIAVKFPFNSNTDLIEVQNKVQAFTEGFMLRNYDFNKYREKSNEAKVDELYFVEENSLIKESILKGFSIGQILSNATNLCRDISNEPGNIMTPSEMANRAKQISESSNGKLNCKIFDKEHLEEFGMGCFLGVAKAGGEVPKMIVLEYTSKPENPYIALIGKGITFDSGGISLKNSSGMFHMKRDMSGASSVIAVMKALTELDLPVNVVAVIGATENMPDSNAYKPGDILRSMSGKTVEITNTDAEGRLVLADLMTYAQRNYQVTSMIDVATLTGAVQRALGSAITGCFTNNKELLSKLMVASEKANEPLWELPLASKLYKGANKSYFADLKNSSDKPPGATKAALFLHEFIENNTPWIHIDIGGTETASGEPSSYYPRGATGVMTRTLIELLRNHTEGSI